MISWEVTGDDKAMDAWLKKLSDGSVYAGLEAFAQQGVVALRNATPIDDGTTANSWYYEILRDSKSWSIIWNNSNIVDGRPIAVLLQLGHGTGTGGYVQGRDYINPALKPVFDQIANAAWKVVTS